MGTCEAGLLMNGMCAQNGDYCDRHGCPFDFYEDEQMKPLDMKPLFIPLKSEYYEAFENGEKDTEFRLYGKRWNAETCKVGRPVVLSKGYGKHNRMTGVISGFKKSPARMLGLAEMSDIESVYGYAALDKDIACISISELE